MINKVYTTYFGGKGGDGVFQTIINQIPPHSCFYSMFLGHDAILRYKLPACFNTGIDIDNKVIKKWKALNLKNFSFENSCAIEWLKRHNGPIFYDAVMKGDGMMYLDPPYPLSTRKSNTRYDFEMTDKQHIELLNIIVKMTCNVAISTYDNDIYKDILKDWRKIHFPAKTRGGSAIETLYMNYPEPVELHDYRYLGNDFRERHRIKKKLNRHIQGLLKLPVLNARQSLMRLLN